MPAQEYSLTPITGYDGNDDPQYGTPIEFDDLRIPLVEAEAGVEVARRPGFDYQGYRLREVAAQEITATAILHTDTPAAGFAVRDAIRALKPTVAAYYGAVATYSDVLSKPYDVLGCQVASFRRRLVVEGDTVNANALNRFVYTIRLIERGPYTPPAP